jgi:hypothetical protein
VQSRRNLLHKQLITSSHFSPTGSIFDANGVTIARAELHHEATAVHPRNTGARALEKVGLIVGVDMLSSPSRNLSERLSISLLEAETSAI